MTSRLETGTSRTLFYSVPHLKTNFYKRNEREVEIMAVLAYEGGFLSCSSSILWDREFAEERGEQFSKKFFNYNLILSQLQAFQEIYMER